MACQPVGGLHLPLSDSDRIQDHPIGTINQHRALKFHLTATLLFGYICTKTHQPNKLLYTVFLGATPC